MSLWQQIKGSIHYHTAEEKSATASLIKNKLHTGYILPANNTSWKSAFVRLSSPLPRAQSPLSADWADWGWSSWRCKVISEVCLERCQTLINHKRCKLSEKSRPMMGQFIQCCAVRLWRMTPNSWLFFLDGLVGTFCLMYVTWLL